MMKSDDHQWLLARERGQSIAHIPDRQRAAYDQLGALIAALPSPVPRPGWQRRVLDAIAREAAIGAAPPAPPHWLDRLRDLAHRLWSPVLAFAGVLLLLLVRAGGPAPLELRVETAIQPGSGAHRARPDRAQHLAAIGDVLIVDATLPATAPGELRAYDDTGELIGRCARGDACATEHDGALQLHLSLATRAPGEVRALMFGLGMPTTGVGFDRDLATAQTAHIDAHQVAVFQVQ